MALDPVIRHAAAILGSSDMQRVIRVRRNYKSVWRWGAGANYLFRELVHAYDLDDHEAFLMSLARPKSGRKRKDDLACLISRLNQAGLNVPKIAITLELVHNIHMSEEAVAAYLKKRRRID